MQGFYQKLSIPRLLMRTHSAASPSTTIERITRSNDYEWYALRVAWKEESRVYKDFCVLQRTNLNWADTVKDVFYFKSTVVKFLGNTLAVKVKSLLPGTIFLQSKMNETIANEILKVDGVVGFIKDRGSNAIKPLGPEESRKMQLLMNATMNEPPIHSSLLGLHKGDLVYVCRGYYVGWFGELLEEKKGKLKVSLHTTYNNFVELFDMNQLRALKIAPEALHEPEKVKAMVLDLIRAEFPAPASVDSSPWQEAHATLNDEEADNQVEDSDFREGDDGLCRFESKEVVALEAVKKFEAIQFSRDIGFVAVSTVGLTQPTRSIIQTKSDEYGQQ